MLVGTVEALDSMFTSKLVLLVKQFVNSSINVSGVMVGGGSAAGVGALDTVPESDTAPCVFGAGAAPHALGRDAPAVPNVDGTAPHVVAAD